MDVSFERRPVPPWLLLILICSLGLGCAPEDPPTTDGGDESRWWSGLPEADLGEIGPEDTFWAAVPAGAGAKIVTVRSEDGGETWLGALKRPVEVPRALVHPLASESVKGEDVVWVVIPGDGAAVGRATAEGTVRVDWNGVTREVEGATPAPASSSPWRIYTLDGSSWRGMEVARGGGSVWLLTAGGQAVEVPEDAVRVQEFRTDWAVGEAVQAFSWAEGLRPGRVVEAVEPGLRFRVEHGSEGAETAPGGTYFFDDLVPSP